MSDLTLFPVKFDVAGYMAEVRSCVNIAFDSLSGKMHDVMCRVIEQCTEAAMVMYMEAQKNVKELSRKITNEMAEIEVGIDEGAIGGGEREYIRVMVSLHGNGEVWARPHSQAWTKYVNSQHTNNVEVEYRLPYFEQSDHSDAMMKSFEHDMKKYIKEFESSLWMMLDSIDYSKYLIGGG